MKRRCLIFGLVTTFCILLVSQGCELVGTHNIQDKTQTSKLTIGDTLSSRKRPLSMLAYYSWAQRCSMSELMEEYGRLERGAKNDDDGSQKIDLRLALLLSLPDRPFSDDVRAYSILKHYLNTEPDDGEDAAFALFLLELLNERERYRSQLKSLQTKVENYQVVMHELRKERALRSKLEDQVQQLKNIEENLMEREQVDIPPTTD